MIPIGAYSAVFYSVENSEIWKTPMQRHLAQIGSGDLNGEFFVYSGTHLISGFRYANRALMGSGVIPTPYTAFGFSLSAGHANLYGKAIKPGTITFAPSGQEFVTIVPDEFKQFFVLLDDEALEDYLHAEDFSTYLAVKSRCNNNQMHSESISSNIIHKVHSFAAYQSVKKFVSPDDLIARDFEHHIIQQIINIEERSEPILSRNNQRSRAIGRAMEFISASDLTSISVQDVVNISCTSQRSLEIAFRLLLGETIKSFLIKCRLNAIRRELLTPTRTTLVRDTAMRYGVLHIGNFIKSYRALFSETPGMTLARSRKIYGITQ